MLREIGKQHNGSFSPECLAEGARSDSPIAGKFCLQWLGTEVKPFQLCVSDPRGVRHWGVSVDGTRGDLCCWKPCLPAGSVSAPWPWRQQIRQGVKAITISMPVSLPGRSSSSTAVRGCRQAPAPVCLCSFRGPRAQAKWVVLTSPWEAGPWMRKPVLPVENVGFR